MTKQLLQAGLIAGGVIATLALSPPLHAQSDNNVPVLLGEFRGTLPCDDCLGMDADLTLVKKDEFTDEGSYTLIETPKGGTGEPVAKDGTWTAVHGSTADPNATVYELNPDGIDPPVNFLKVDRYTLRLLAPNRDELPGSEPRTLTYDPNLMASMPNPASINCVKVGGRSLIHEGTTVGEQGVCRLPDGRECEEWAMYSEHACVAGAKPKPPPRPPGAPRGGGDDD